MIRLILAALCASLLFACTEAGDGSEVKQDSTPDGKDTITQMNNSGSATSKDTSSYERLPTTQHTDTNSNN
jgi:hypothetical protein